MKDSNAIRIKWACYTANITMSVVAIMSPLLFATFLELYEISYGLLGLLVLINFISQLLVDMIFTFFSNKFNMSMTVKSIPIIALIGFLFYAMIPILFPEVAYLGLVIGTIIFSSASGINEVLITPVIAALPAENPEKEMSKLHSTYAWGVVGVTIFSTIVLHFLDRDHWYVLVFLLMIVPCCSAFLFSKATMPELEVEHTTSGVIRLCKDKSMIFCFFLIFFGGGSENVISQWSSGYLEETLQLPKIFGDIIGVAFFATMLGLGRTLYAHRGKNIAKTMLCGAMAAVVCYLVLIFVDIPVIAVLACAFSGYCVAMLWPGSLIVVQEKLPHGGVAMFAFMAAGGDLGSAIAGQLVGYVADIAMMNESIPSFGASLGYMPEQIAMKCGMLVTLVFPIMSVVLLVGLCREKQK